MVGECVRFLFTSCEGSLNERVPVSDPSQRVNNKNRTNHEVICLLYEYKDECIEIRIWVGSKIANSVGEGNFKYDEFMTKTTDTFHFQTVDTYTVFHMLLSISA